MAVGDLNAMWFLLDQVREFKNEHRLAENSKRRIGKFIGLVRAEAITRGFDPKPFDVYLPLAK